MRDVVVRRVVRGSVEYLEAPVWITDGATTTRQTARMLLDTSDGDEAVDLPGQGYPVYIRVTDASEIAIVQAGSLELVG